MSRGAVLLLCVLAILFAVEMGAAAQLQNPAGSPPGIPPQILNVADANKDGQITFDELKAVLPMLTQQFFDLLDRNDDGVLSQDDVEKPSPENIEARLRWYHFKADANKDGDVTLEELQAVWPAFSEAAFDFLDTNDDGVLNIADLPAGPPPNPGELWARLLRAADADNNGEITFEELQALAPELTQERFDNIDRDDDGVLTPADFPAFQPGPIERLEAFIEQADANGDGKVSFEELQAMKPEATQELFNKLDTNDDGFLTLDDLPAPPVDVGERLRELLHQADADANGEVTFDELLVVAQDLTQEQFDTLDRNGDDVISSADLPERPRDPRGWLLDKLCEADTNDDQQVTFDELKAVLPELTQEQFDQLDRNDDGVLTADDAPDRPIPSDDVNRVKLLRALIRADANHDGALDFDEIAQAFPDAPSELLDEIDTNDDWVITRDEIRAALAESETGKQLIAPSDIDADGASDALDVQLTINNALRILNGTVLADVDGDNECDALDVQMAINGALRMTN